MNPRFAIRRGLLVENNALEYWLPVTGSIARILAHLPEVSLHPFTRSPRVVALDRIEDSFVVNLSAFRAAIDIEDSHALFTQQSNDGIDQRENERVRGRFGQRKMKIEIRLDEGVGIVHRVVHYIDRLSHRCKVLIVSTNCRQGSDLRFQNFAKLHQVGGPV
jgi:hypothetical protein